MKKLLSIIITFLLCFSFASCKNGTVENVTEYSAKEETFSILSSEAATEETALTSIVATTTEMRTTKQESSSKSVTTERKTETTGTTGTTVVTTKQAVSATVSDILNTVKRTTASTTEAVTVSVTAEETNEVFVPVATTKKTQICTVSIDCSVILDNEDRLKEEKAIFVPNDGKILNNCTVEFETGETVFEVLKRACKENVCEENCSVCQNIGIQLESEYTPAYDSYYVEGIHQLYEKDCGSRSGWMYRVNGEFLNVGSSSYTLKDGDVVEWIYTCDLGGEFMN